MACFKGDTFTYTKENASERDARLPSMNNLSMGSIASSSALAGLGGIDTSYVKGTRREYITQDQITERLGNLQDTTHQNETKLVMQDQDEKIQQSSTLQIGQDRWKTTKGNTIEHYLGTNAIVYMSPKNVEEPAEFFHHVEEKISYGTYHMDTFISYALVSASSMSGFLLNLDVRGYNLGLLVAANEFRIIKEKEGAEEVSIVAMRQTIRVTEAFAVGVEPGVAAAYMHEVAITQEILAVGANQAL
jgi:hypothetical protein